MSTEGSSEVRSSCLFLYLQLNNVIQVVLKKIATPPHWAQFWKLKRLSALQDIPQIFGLESKSQVFLYGNGVQSVQGTAPL